MKITAPSLAFAAACAVALILPRARAAAEAGAPAPDFTVTDVAGKSHSLAGYRGKVVVLEWLSPGCPFVVRHYKSGNMQSTQAAAAADGVIWLQINSSAVGDMDPVKSAEWQKKQGVAAAAYIRDSSGRLGRLFGARTTPHLYVIARDGVLAYEGAIDDQPNASVLNTMAAHNYVSNDSALIAASG